MNPEIESLLKNLRRRVDNADKVIGYFKAALEHDPAAALSGSRAAMESAAVRLVSLATIATLEAKPELTLAEVRAFLTARVLDGARDPKFSTSPTANLMDAFRTAAFASLLADLEWLV